MNCTAATALTVDATDFFLYELHFAEVLIIGKTQNIGFVLFCILIHC